METVIFSGLAGFALAVALFIVLWFKKLKRPKQIKDVEIYSTVEKMQSEVQKSAVQTLEILAKSFGAKRIAVDFSDADLIQTEVNYIPIEKDANEKSQTLQM